MTAVVPAVREPADQAARTQIRGELDLTLNVVAGAGTGKTHELVERVVGLLADIPMSEIGVITFTTAAASELQERIREQVELLAANEPGDGPYTRALHALDDAAISTLHAFAQRILAEHPLEASLPPGFEVLDPIQESVAFEEWWQRTLDHLFADASLAPSLLVLGALGVKPDRYRQLARILTDHHDRTAGYGIKDLPVPRLDLGPLLDALDAATSLRSSCTDPSDRLLVHLDTLDELAGRLRVLADDELEALALLGERSKLTCTFGRGASWRDDGKDLAAKACSIAHDERLAAIAAITQPAISNVLGALVREVATAAKWRQHEGRVTFHDLLVLARNLLRDDARVRTALSDHYRVLLLDEFQDTDPLQIDLAMRIGGTAIDAELAPSWSDITPRPGALFVVGDPKQSIYRFRRADIELYGQVIDTLTDDVLQLTESFRSRPGIIEWVNAALGALIQADDDGLQVAYSPLHAFRPADPEVPVPVARLGGAAPKKSIPLGDLRVREAGELAALARRVRAEGWRVKAQPDEPGATRLDPASDEWVRPARFADVAVLVPTRTLLPELEAAFEAADVPLRIESQSLLFATTECRDLVSILGAIDDPADEIRLVAALRTPAFGCSDADLFEYRDAGGRWSIFRDAPEGLAAEHPVVVGLADLRELHDQHRWETPAGTVERVIRERALFTLALAKRRPRDHWRRLRFLTDAAHAFTDAGGASLRGFVQWLDEQREEGARVNESVVAEPDDDAVRVLTVHGSKGLEFPIVFLAGLGVGYRANPAALYHGDSVPELRLTAGSAGSWTTPGYGDRAAREDRADRAEGVRLLYVRDDEGARPPRRQPAPPRRHELPRRGDRTGRRGASPAVAGRDDRARSGAAAESDRDPAELGRRGSARADGRRGAGRLVARPACGDRADQPRGGHRRDRHRPRVGARAGSRGRRVVGGGAGGRSTRVASGSRRDRARACGARGAADRGSRDRRRHRGRGPRPGAGGGHPRPRGHDRGAGPERARGTDDPRRGLGADLREVPVAAEIDGITIEGFIDLLVVDGEELTVVDYKTDAARTDAEIDAALARYGPQGAAYALALEHVLGRPVTRCVFVFARGQGPAIERAVEDLRGLVAEVRAGLPAAVAAPPA